MYIAINDIKGEKRIDLSYPIYPKKEITVQEIIGLLSRDHKTPIGLLSRDHETPIRLL